MFDCYMKELIKEELTEYGKEEIDVSELTQELYNDESNFNNADPTSGMRCFSYEEIEQEIFKQTKVKA